MLFALADALENLADEVMTLDALGPIDYIEYKIDDFLMKVDDFITDITSEPKSEESDYTEEDEVWDDPVPESTETAAEKPAEEEKTVVDIEPEQKPDEESATIIYSEEAVRDKTTPMPETEMPEMNAEETDVKEESDDDASPDDTSSDAGIEADIAFCNAHLDKIKGIITAAKKINVSKYSEQQEYLQDVFELSADKCWNNYLKKELAEEKEKPDADLDALNSITEQSIKDMVICIATTMFLQLAVESLSKED